MHKKIERARGRVKRFYASVAVRVSLIITNENTLIEQSNTQLEIQMHAATASNINTIFINFSSPSEGNALSFNTTYS